MKSTSSMRQWIQVAQPHIWFCLQVAKQQLKFQSSDIRKHLINPPKTRLPPKYKKLCRHNRKTDTEDSTVPTNLLYLPEKALSSYFHAIPSRRSDKRHQDKQDKRPIKSSTDLTEYFSDQDRPPDKRKRYTQTSILDSLILKNYFIYPFIPTHPGIPKMPLRPWPVTAQLKLGLSSHCLRVVKCVLVILVIIR